MTEFRTFNLADVEFRAAKREVAGLLVPFNARTTVGHYAETFLPGSFQRTIAERGQRVKLLESHDSTKPLGRAVHLAEESRGLAGAFRISRTTAGDEALELVADGAFDSFSIGFQSVTGGDRWSRSRDHVERLEVRLLEVSLVTLPAYESARVESIRGVENDAALHPSIARARLVLATL